MPDDKAEAQSIHQMYSGKPEELATELARICLYKPGVVYQLFLLLNNHSTLDVGCRFIRKCDVYQLVRSRDGLLLCTKLHQWLSSGLDILFPPTECSGYSMTMVMLKNAVDTAKITPVASNQPRELSETEMNFYSSYNQTPDVMWNFSKKKWNQNGPRVNFNKEICWDLPTSGVGFTVYNQDDLNGKRNDKYGYDQIGTKGTIDAMVRIAKEWNALHPDRLLQYGDISRPGGINTPDHGTHMTGKAFDMRLLRNDSKLLGLTYNDNAYHRDYTKEFILLAVKLYPGTTVYFNDSVLHKDPQTRTLVAPSGGHDDHLHIMFPGGRE